MERWVPVEYINVAPDGESYILSNDRSVGIDFYLVDVKTGNRKFLLSGDGPPQAPGSWTILRYASEGVYLRSGGAFTIPGVWLLDLKSNNVRLIDGSHYWRAVAGNAAWALEPPFGQPADIYRVFRLDMKSGEVSTWYEGKIPIRMLSPTPDGDLLVSYGEFNSGRLQLMTAPNQLVPLEVPPDFPPNFEMYMTRPGVWVTLASGGIALYDKAHGVRVISRTPEIGYVAGDCR